ncbi:hypothetical protein DENIS_1164 [Desulfonema ishimotonii]|uniref:Uncharacterized protein n=1 Tax=Desulfonema ishimotonii TaxID=45657 RepID=A0A401FTD2_9BACT|nr:hypothetical protein [Desulfonema ishimotonii]GBC60213.1 hypothetical protein DENIS_1164 [Desulfonema ishimotonii]
MSVKNESLISEQVDNRLDDLFGTDAESQEGRVDNGERPDENSSPEDHAASAELDNRLDNFFGQKGTAGPDAESRNAVDLSVIEDSPIKNLKSVILSLEWEITDQVMQKLGEEILALEATCKSDKIMIAFLQLLGSLGKYIRKKRAEAHPDSIRLLHSVYESLEKVMLSDDMSDDARKKILVAQVNNYKKLKEEIVVAKTTKPSVEKAVSSPREATGASDAVMDETTGEKEESADDMGAVPYDTGRFPETSASHQEILRSMREIRETIQAEFSALRKEIRLLKEGR